MNGRIAGLCLGLVLSQVQASDRWSFTDKIPVGELSQVAVFHHLDGSGRRHIAVAENSVAVVWEDNRSGDPQVYVASRHFQQQSFSSALLASGGSEAYEPAIDAIDNNRFVIAFEQDASIFARVLAKDGLGEPVRLSESAAGHASITRFQNQVFASWRERDQGLWHVKVARLRVDSNDRLVVESRQSVEADGLEAPALFPAIAVNAAGLCIAWEDRRAGHTRLLFSYSSDNGKSFSDPASLNEFFSNRNEYDRGNGVTRVALASFGQDEILAAWMDKRRGGKGYGIFAALGAEGGEEFGPDEKVHGEQGDTQPHYNPATAGNADGEFAVAWDDFRHGNSDIWISYYNEDLEWSEDFTAPIASGAGEQSHPSIVLDEQHNLHLLWIERDELNSPSRLWYSFGRADLPL